MEMLSEIDKMDRTPSEVYPDIKIDNKRVCMKSQKYSKMFSELFELFSFIIFINIFQHLQTRETLFSENSVRKRINLCPNDGEPFCVFMFLVLLLSLMMVKSYKALLVNNMNKKVKINLPTAQETLSSTSHLLGLLFVPCHMFLVEVMALVVTWWLSQA